MNKKRLIYAVMSVVMFISGGILLFYFFWANGFFAPPKSVPQETYSEFTYPSMPDEIEPSATGNGNNAGKETSKSGEGLVNPVNFEELQKANPDIIGWLYMTSPYVSQPVLMSKKSDDYYLYRDATGKNNKDGAFYIEKSYNKPSFDDPCTIIYGHRRSDGAMFGNLQATLDEIDINADPQYIVIYLPNSTKIYHIIATNCHNSGHILHYNNFGKKSEFDSFFNKIYSSKGSGVQLVKDDRPEFGDKILIISTCLRTDRTKRYLVIAKELT